MHINSVTVWVPKRRRLGVLRPFRVVPYPRHSFAFSSGACNTRKSASDSDHDFSPTLSNSPPPVEAESTRNASNSGSQMLGKKSRKRQRFEGRRDGRGLITSSRIRKRGNRTLPLHGYTRRSINRLCISTRKTLQITYDMMVNERMDCWERRLNRDGILLKIIIF